MALFKKNTSGFNFKIPPDNDPWKFVTDPNDPAYQSYNDSLFLYNNNAVKGPIPDEFRFSESEKNKMHRDLLNWGGNYNAYDKNKLPVYKDNPDYKYQRLYLNNRMFRPVEISTQALIGNVNDYKDYATWKYDDRDIYLENYGDHVREYTAAYPNIVHTTIKPTAWNDGAYYDRPNNPVFLKGTKQADNAEKQIMLQKAGLYTGKIDGIWGNKSIAAMQQYELQQQNSTPVQSTGQTVTPTAQQQNITQSQPTSRVVAPTTQQPTVEAKPVVPKVVSGVSKNYGAYTSTSGKSPNIAESNSFGSSTNTKGYYYTVRYTDGTTETLTPSEYEQLYGSSKNKAFKKTTNL